ncbi:hypothetical protein CSC33_4752 [Pseudomonas aeruginosa]|nr:hypothetical protein CSC33_4752 [Pseudomonas aeruginosa]
MARRNAGPFFSASRSPGACRRKRRAGACERKNRRKKRGG